MGRKSTAEVFKRPFPMAAAMAVLGAAVLGVPTRAHAHHAMEGESPYTLVEALLGHPVLGLVHVAFVVAVGWFAAKMIRGVWTPVAFVGGTLGGAALVVMALWAQGMVG